MSWIKYKVEVHQVYSNGQWVDIEPLETRLSDPMGIYDTMEECYRGNIPQYQWVDNPELEPICDDCYDPIYRWHQMDDSNYMCEQAIPQYRYVNTTGTMCVACDKYNRAIQQVSYDSGATWTNVDPPVYSATTLVEADCPDCCQHRWHQADASNYACDNANKYYKEVYQVSYDSGVTWSDVYPEQSRRTDTLIEADSYDCGYRTGETSGETYCNMFDKCVDVYSQVSRDYGNTWETTATTTTVVEAASPDCIPYQDEYFTVEAVDDMLFRFSGQGAQYWFSKDSGETWDSKYDSINSNIGISAGNSVLFRAQMQATTAGSWVGITRIVASGRYKVRGNIDSLIHGETFRNKNWREYSYSKYQFANLFSNQTNLVDAEKLCIPGKIAGTSCFSNMFYGCTSLTKAPLSLPARTLSTSCYFGMFKGCTSLTTTPVLPATTLRDECYGQMFNGCTSLVTAPALPATTLAQICYRYMFSNCTSLTTPPELPATSLEGSCYYGMFSGCTSLTTAPQLSATSLANNCYYDMFSDCTALTTAPDLPATTLANYCYYRMFLNCRSLTTAPYLPAETLVDYCYRYMFSSCISLNHIECNARYGISSNNLYNWTYNVSSSGTFVKNANATWSTGVDGIPSGWTVEDAT